MCIRDSFLAVAEAVHFTRASERLLIAQPSLSRHIRELEDALSVELFFRDARGVRLTEAGRELLSRAQRLMAMLERTVDAVRSAAIGGRGRLRLGYYGPSFYNNLVTRSAFERFRAEAPDVEVISHELFSEQVVPALRDGRIDVAISRGVSRVPDLEYKRIGIERLVVLLPESDDLSAKAAVSLADLDGRGLIAFQTALTVGFNQRIQDIGREAHVPLRIVREVNQLPSIAYLVSRGEGIALLPASSGFPFPGVAIREISDPGATMDLLAMTRRGEDSPVALRFMELLGTISDEPA